MTRIAVSFNDAYLRYAIVMLTSLLLNASGGVKVFILTDGLSPDSANALGRLFGAFHNVMYTVVVVDSALFSDIDLSRTHVTKETFFRFLLPDVLSFDRVLYLDCDIIVRADVAELYDLPFDGNCTVAVPDLWLDAQDPERLKLKLGLAESDPYVNAGLLLMDLESWRKGDLGKRAIRLACDQGSRLPYFDQDALNLVIRGRVKTVSELWNFASWNYDRHKAIRRQAKILHYTGSVKPWTKRSRRWKDCVWKYYSLLAERTLRTGRCPGFFVRMVAGMEAWYAGS